MAIQVAAPSSSLGFTSSKTKYRYDVFLSFRGEDTRLTFTVRLHDALCRKGINAFIDDKKLAKGEEISPTLLKAIEKSRISIIVFSTNYATSTWCLEELARIVWCRKQKNQVVMPIFYKVDPLDVQKQRNSFGEAMADHKAGRFKNEQEKVQKWRAALHEAASLSPAWLFEDGCESGFIERIVEHAYSMIPPKRFQNIDHMVGLETRIEEVMSLMDKSDDRVCMLGIYGTGGIGKTTLAKALYKLIFYQFDGACFLFDVREESNKYQSIIRLQQTLLSEILGEQKMQLNSVDEGISYIKHRLSSKKVLLVLDDVDEFKQLEQLAGGRDWFGCGSKIIITTRNKELLIARNVEKTYEVKELSRLCSLELFCWHAFRMSQPPNGYENMSNHVIRYVHGLPLALKLVGSNLAHKDFEEWRSTLEQYKRIPERTIHEVLKISYDCLPDGAKRVFLDIACFFKKKALEFIEDILEACDDGARFYIEVLVDKSLITIDENSSRLYMHDLIQQMGKEIVRQEGPSNLGQRSSRLWYYRDVLEVLQENSGSSNIEGIILDPPHQEKVEWGGIAFEKMNNLKILIIRNAQFSTSSKYFPNTLRLLDWKGYPSMTLPPNFSPSKLICLKLNGSQFTLEEPFKKSEFMTHVTYLDFSKCQFITEVPDMSQLQNLKTMIVNKCLNLTKVHDSVGSLSKLERLDVSESEPWRFKWRRHHHPLASPAAKPSIDMMFSSVSGCEDTRLSPSLFVSHDALCRKGINAFIDDKKLAKGEEISPTLLKAIEKSRISIIVFSTNYATSTWCLEELARIVWCRKQKNQKQRNSFGEAMADHKAGRFKNEQEKVQKWRAALHEAASLSQHAWAFEDGIVEHAYSMIPPKRFQNIDHMVGLETRIEEVMSLMDKSDDRTLLSEILGEQKMQLNSVDEGISYIKHRLSSKKVLLVLDDVDEFKQLEQLAGGRDWFGCGSKIIITTRNKELLIARNVEKTYEVKELSRLCSLELFCWHAFRMSQPPNGYENMSNHVIRYVHGLPLALKLVGSNWAHKDFEEWRSTLEQYKRIPERTIHEVLKISYDCLPDGAKRVFLDIACFFKKKALEFIEDILEACDDGARFYIEVLVDKSLITIDENSSRLYMHDLIQQMGKEIVRQEGPSNLGQRSRLWYYRGSSNIEGIILDPPHQEKVEWGGIAFEKMNNLKILIIRNAQFSTKTMIVNKCLNLTKVHDSVGSLSKLERLDVSECPILTSFPHEINMASLQELNLEFCKSLDYFPHIVGKMEHLFIVSAVMTAIKELPPSIGNLPPLCSLDLSSCTSLRELPNSLLTLPNLEDLGLEGIHSLGRESLKTMMQQSQSIICCENIETLNLRNFGLLDEDLHLTLKCFQNVEDLDLSGNDFVSLPECIKECAYLERLSLTNCKRLRDIVELPSSLQHIAAENCMSLTMESIGRLWSQAKEGFAMEIVMPATTFPDWLDYCCKGAKLSFRVRGNMPRIVFAYQTGKANTKWVYMVEVFMSINGCNKMPWIQTDRVARKRGRVLYKVGDQGHVYFFDLLSDFSEELEELNKFLGLDWNDVDIQVTCDPPDLSIVNCGIYVDKRQTNMENIQFKSPLLSMNASTTSLKRKAIASHPNEPPRKHLRRFKEKTNYTNKTTRKSKRHQIFHSQYKRKMFFPMAKHLWRALYS
ncbi:uncharacterized protein LOC129286213 [Prosopis cineraria]|uniref:uncharacterized protein LOC129286213 n=1 Tax=Prosopis cineraria TaxID=364024 RepID=UPI00240F57C0|nr:uncharacterized protein LOC129286213 [Prosopis cineraria]